MPHYEVKGSGAPVLFIPGLLSNSVTWGPVTRRLSGVQAVFMENQDRGQIRDMAQDAFAVLDHAQISSAHIAGHSLGGAIALEMSLLQPERVRSLTLVNTWAKTDAYSGSVMRLLAMLRRRLTDDAEFLHAQTFVVNAAAPLQLLAMEDIARSILNFGTMSQPETTLRHLQAAEAHDVLDRLAAVSCPTQVIWGDEDKIFPPWHARQLAQSISGAKDLGLKGVGHMAILQAADAVATVLARAVS